MQERKLPDGAYAALAGLKGQAAAAMTMIDKDKKKEARIALTNAHALVAENRLWVARILKALMQGKDGTTMDTVDEAWLEKNLSC